MSQQLYLSQDQVDSIQKSNIKVNILDDEDHHSILIEVDINSGIDVFQLFMAGVRYGVLNHDKYDNSEPSF